uniref:BED-type domain-containing protein n=1 Tax=Romanomermis culicivorax TaxID=13658 RepID=A0A915IIB5_ROMCU
MATKRKNLYREEYSKDFDGIKKSRKGDTFAFCSYCSSDIDIGSTGALAISRHCSTKLHEENSKSKKSTAEIGQFFVTKNTPVSKKTSAAEAVLSYHTAVHSLSF